VQVRLASRVVRRTWASQRQHVRAVIQRPVRGGPSQRQTAFVRDTVHQKQSEMGMFWKVGGGILKFFPNFQKIEKCWKLSKKRTKPRIFEKFHIQIFFSKFSKIFENFNFFFKGVLKRWMPVSVNATSFLCRLLSNCFTGTSLGSRYFFQVCYNSLFI
jgi:hypothetical protein